MTGRAQSTCRAAGGRPLVALLGASGAVGSAAARVLAGEAVVRLGGRRPEPLERLAAELPGTLAHPLDLDDDRALTAFCAEADVVLHCAAPAFAIGDRVARAARYSSYVDVSGDAELQQRLSDGPVPKTAVLGAGVVPGLSALLPRHVLARSPGADRVTVHTGGVEPCSPGVARDMLLSLDSGGVDGAGYGEPLAAWRNRVVSRALRAEEDTEVPGFSGRVASQPFLSAESARLAQAAGLATLDWFNVHPGPRVRDTMRRLRGTDPDRAAADLQQAADLDLLGRERYHLLVVTATDAAGRGLTATLRSRDSYTLTGTVAAVATRAVLHGAVPAGVGYAGEVLDPTAVLDAVATLGAARLALRPVDADDHVEEGAL